MNVILTPPQAEIRHQSDADDGMSAQRDDPIDHIRNVIQSFSVISSGSRGCIVVVDDNECVRETLSELLEVAGFTVFQAADAAEAMIVLQQQPSIDAMVTDLTMPGDNGITLIRQARLFKGELPAILLTGYAEQVAAITTIAGATIARDDFHVLRKPVESERLIAHLDLMVRPPPAG